jgi:hypothetical protein
VSSYYHILSAHRPPTPQVDLNVIISRT